MIADPSDPLADWSSWKLFADAVKEAPRKPGVYMARDHAAAVVYVGMAAERRGQGIRGRLTVYWRGRAAVSGLGEAAMDRALADPAWLRSRADEVAAGTKWRTRDWAKAALQRAELELRWAETPTGAEARALEDAVLKALNDVALWNRARPVLQGLEP